jgi:hypothetical protein
MKRGCKITLWVLAGIVFLHLAAFGFLGWELFSDQSKYQEHLASFEGLPSTASDITVYTNRNITGTLLAEFTIREDGFSDWAKSLGWDVSEITGTVSIYTPYPYRADDPLRPIPVGSGLYYSKHGSNGAGVDVAFDRSRGRALIFKSNR